jgi:hypothetical protein
MQPYTQQTAEKQLRGEKGEEFPLKFTLSLLQNASTCLDNSLAA